MGVIYVSGDLLANRSSELLMGTLIHELVHETTGRVDEDLKGIYFSGSDPKKIPSINISVLFGDLCFEGDLQ
jgi:hypothetical protein